MLRKSLLLFIILLSGYGLFAQVIGDTISSLELPLVKVIKYNKKEYIGKLIRDDGTQIVLRMSNGVDLPVAKIDIKKIEYPIASDQEIISADSVISFKHNFNFERFINYDHGYTTVCKNDQEQVSTRPRGLLFGKNYYLFTEHDCLVKYCNLKTFFGSCFNFDSVPAVGQIVWSDENGGGSMEAVASGAMANE